MIHKVPTTIMIGGETDMIERYAILKIPLYLKFSIIRLWNICYDIETCSVHSDSF